MFGYQALITFRCGSLQVNKYLQPFPRKRIYFSVLETGRTGFLRLYFRHKVRQSLCQATSLFSELWSEKTTSFIVYFMQEMNRFGEKGLIWSKSIGKNYSVTGIHIQYYSYLLTLKAELL